MISKTHSVPAPALLLSKDTAPKLLFLFPSLKVIPAKTDLIMNMASVLHDEKIFENPEAFKPQQYLEGDTALKKQRTITFGLGM